MAWPFSKLMHWFLAITHRTSLALSTGTEMELDTSYLSDMLASIHFKKRNEMGRDNGLDSKWTYFRLLVSDQLYFLCVIKGIAVRESHSAAKKPRAINQKRRTDSLPWHSPVDAQKSQHRKTRMVNGKVKTILRLLKLRIFDGDIRGFQEVPDSLTSSWLLHTLTFRAPILNAHCFCGN